MKIRTMVTPLFVVMMVATHHPIYGMFRAAKTLFGTARRHPVKVVLGAALAHQEWQNRKKTHFMYDVTSHDIQALTDGMNAVRIQEEGSPTAKHIVAYHQSKYPHKHTGHPDQDAMIDDMMHDGLTWFVNPDAYTYDPTIQNMIDDIVWYKYREFPLVGLPLDRKQREGLRKVLLHCIEQERAHADTHYVFYHGTFTLPALIFRTMMAEKYANGDQPVSFLHFRDPGINDHFDDVQDPAEYMKKMWDDYQEFEKRHARPGINPADARPFGGKPINEAFYGPDDIPEAQGAFISANIAALGNTGFFASNGENSLTFISTVPTGGDDGGPILGKYVHMVHNYFSILLTALSKVTNGQFQNDDSSYAKKMHGGNSAQMHQTARRYNAQVEQFAHEFDYLNQQAAFGSLIQIFIPKDKIDCTYTSGPWGWKRPEPIESMMEYMKGHTDTYEQQGVNLDDLQARILIAKPFYDPQSGIKMNVFGFGDEQEFRNFLIQISQIVKD